MSVKSERRAWYAANVAPMPCEDRSSAEWIAWRDKANAHMRRICVDGTAEVRPEFLPGNVATVEDPEIARLRTALTDEPGEIASFGRRASVAAPSSEDRAAYDAFVDAQLRAFGEYTGEGGASDDLWDRAKLQGRRAVADLEPFKGPLHVARPYLNGDALDALERGVIRWVTFAEFRLERAQLRAAEAEQDELEREAWESAESCVMCLERVCECEALIDWAA